MKVGGKVCVVTGGANGLGRNLVDTLLAKKAIVVALDFADSGCDDLVSNPSFLFCKTDVANEESVKQAFQKVMSKFGKVHVVVNCAGISTASRVVLKTGEPHPLDLFQKVVNVNLVGTFNVLRVAASIMAKQEPVLDEPDTPERGVIINVASVAAFEGQVGQAAYAASKSGVVGMTLPISRELAKVGIRCMTIAPGIFMTPMLGSLPEKVVTSLNASVPFPSRVGRPDEFSKLACNIIDNAYLNGTVIRIDGSIRMSAM